MLITKFGLIDKLQAATIEESVQKLKESGRALIVRPTGFGKTYISMQIAKNYKHLYFITPRVNIINTIPDDYGIILNSLVSYKLSTYQNLAIKHAMDDDELLEYFEDCGCTNDESTIFIFDEAHMLPADKISQVAYKLFTMFPNSHYLGLTATPFRTDGRDVGSIFNHNQISKYSISNAIDDGLFDKLNYILGYFDIPLDIADDLNLINKSILEHAGSTLNIKRLPNNILGKYFDKIQLNTAKDILKKYLIDDETKLCNQTSYHKIFIFFSNINNMEKMYDKYMDIFSEIFPSYTINGVMISSKHSDDNNVWDDICYHHNENNNPNTIDLVFSVNMLNMSVHTDELTAVILSRSTESDNLYLQEIGRVFSITSVNPPIIFDFMGDGNYTRAVRNKRLEKNQSYDNSRMDVFAELEQSGNINIYDELKGFDEIKRLRQIEESIEVSWLEASIAYVLQGKISVEEAAKICNSDVDYLNTIIQIKKYEWGNNIPEIHKV